MTITPRDDFRKSDFAKGWSDLVAGPRFENAAKTAMLEMQLSLCTGGMIKESAEANAYRLHGARQFLEILMSLTDSPTPPAQPKGGLNYKA